MTDMADTDIRPMDPKGLEMQPAKPVEIPKQTPVDVPETVPAINDSVNILDIIILYVRERLINDILSFKKGLDPMNLKDPKTTISGIIAILAQIAKLFGWDISPELLNAISTIFIAIGLAFAKDSTPAAKTDAPAK